MRLNKVVTKLIDKHLVARIDCASGNDVAAMKNAARDNVEIVAERVGRTIDVNFVADVIAAKGNELHDPPEDLDEDIRS